jgi:hypothetical protein
MREAIIDPVYVESEGVISHDALPFVSQGMPLDHRASLLDQILKL